MIASILMAGNMTYQNYIKVDNNIKLSNNVIQLALSENDKDTVIMTEVYKTDLAVKLIDTLPTTLINKINHYNISNITNCNIEVQFWQNIIGYTAWDKYDNRIVNEKVIVTIDEIKLYLFNLFYHYPDIYIFDILGLPYLKQHCYKVEWNHSTIVQERLVFWNSVK